MGDRLARHRPTLALAIALTGFWLAPLDANFAFVALVPAGYALACAAAAAPPRASARALVLALAGAAATALPAFEHRGAVVPFALCLLAAWLLGTLLGQQRRYRDELAEATLVEERLRIARDVHDVLAHSVSLITVQAGYGSLVAPTRPAEAADVLATIAQTGRETLGEIRRLVTVLRHHDVEATRPPRPRHSLTSRGSSIRPARPAYRWRSPSKARSDRSRRLSSCAATGSCRRR